MDERLRDLERASKAVPDDLDARFRFRVECVRLEKFDLAGVEPGDIVIVDEVESPWIRGQWEGVVLQAFEAKDKYVRPTHPQKCDFRVRPSKEYLAKGLYLTRLDQAILRFPRVPGQPVDPNVSS